MLYIFAFQPFLINQPVKHCQSKINRLTYPSTAGWKTDKKEKKMRRDTSLSLLTLSSNTSQRNLRTVGP